MLGATQVVWGPPARGASVVSTDRKTRIVVATLDEDDDADLAVEGAVLYLHFPDGDEEVQATVVGVDDDEVKLRLRADPTHLMRGTECEFSKEARKDVGILPEKVVVGHIVRIIRNKSRIRIAFKDVDLRALPLGQPVRLTFYKRTFEGTPVRVKGKDMEVSFDIAREELHGLAMDEKVLLDLRSEFPETEHTSSERVALLSTDATRVEGIFGWEQVNYKEDDFKGSTSVTEVGVKPTYSFGMRQGGISLTALEQQISGSPAETGLVAHLEALKSIGEEYAVGGNVRYTDYSYGSTDDSGTRYGLSFGLVARDFFIILEYEPKSTMTSNFTYGNSSGTTHYKLASSADLSMALSLGASFAIIGDVSYEFDDSSDSGFRKRGINELLGFKAGVQVAVHPGLVAFGGLIRNRDPSDDALLLSDPVPLLGPYFGANQHFGQYYLNASVEYLQGAIQRQTGTDQSATTTTSSDQVMEVILGGGMSL